MWQNTHEREREREDIADDRDMIAAVIQTFTAFEMKGDWYKILLQSGQVSRTSWRITPSVNRLMLK